MIAPETKKFLYFSLAAHFAFLLILVLGLDFSSPLPVVENTNQHDVISAVVLGDSPKSKLLPQKVTVPTPPPPSKLASSPKITKPLPEVKKDAIALKIPTKKKPVKPIKDLFAQDLLADVKKQAKQKQVKQKELQSKYAKMLKEQAEQSLRQQLLDEDIKLQGKQMRQAQGEVNKYKALILQVVSEHWVVPTQVKKTLVCELMIRLAPGGMVLDVQVTKPSGDPSLDNSARAAVLKSSPLPVPSNPAAFEAFRQFVLKVKPEDILVS